MQTKQVIIFRKDLLKGENSIRIKRQIDEKICNAHKKIWEIANKNTDNDKR